MYQLAATSTEGKGGISCHPAAILNTSDFYEEIMNYEKIYRDFIAERRTKEAGLTGYTEKHHILPRSLGGDNSAGNLIRLTAGDHYFAHCCLAKIHGGKMWFALSALAQFPGRGLRRGYFTGRALVEQARIKSITLKSESAKKQHANGLSSLANSESAKAKKSATMKARIKAGGHGHLRTVDKNYRKKSETMKSWYLSEAGLAWKARLRERMVKNNPARN